MPETTDQQVFGCPTGEVTEEYGKVLAYTSLAGKKIKPLPKKTLKGLLAAAPALRGEPRITKQAYHTSSGKNAPPCNRVVIHTAECDCKPGMADAIGNYFASSGSGGSAQYGVDPAEEGHYVKEAVVAWHAPPNQYSIGIEIMGRASFSSSTWASAACQQAIQRAAARTADLCIRYSLPVVWLSPNDLKAGKRGITGHVCVSEAFHQSTHTDPGPHFPISQFLSMVQSYVGGHPTPTPHPTPHPTPTPGRSSTTTRAVQKAVHASVDGKWGKQTDQYCARVRDTHPGSGSSAVKALQKQLGIGDDGKWGPVTESHHHSAVVGVQAAVKVKTDGDWGPKTEAAFSSVRRANYGKY